MIGLIIVIALIAFLAIFCAAFWFAPKDIGKENHTVSEKNAYSSSVNANISEANKYFRFAYDNKYTAYRVTKYLAHEPCATIPNVYNDGINGKHFVASIDDYAFSGCSELTNVTIPDSVTRIGEGAFYNCSGLTKITIPNSVTCIGKAAFTNCFELTNAEIGNGVTAIGDCLFGGCRKLTSVTIGNRVTAISDFMFFACPQLTHITLPASLTSIGRVSFFGCGNLTSIHYAGDITGWCKIKTVLYITAQDNLNPSNGLCVLMEKKSNATTLYINGKKIEGDLVIPEGVTYIPPFAFYNCNELRSVTIPSSMKSIGDEAFKNCNRLIEVYNKSCLDITVGSTDYGYIGYYAKNIYTEENQNKLSTDVNGYITYTDGNEKILIGYNGKENNLILPQGITAINQFAFCQTPSKSYLENMFIAFPEFATSPSCRRELFNGCTFLTSITIPDSVTNIDALTFLNCKGLISVTIGNNVTNIGDFAFTGCDKLVEIYNKSSLNIQKGSSEYGYIGYNAKDIYLSAKNMSKLSIDDDGFIIYNDGNIKLLMGYIGKATNIAIPKGINEIYKYAFTDNSNLTNITIPDSVTSIGESAFDGCCRLMRIVIPDSVTSIGEYAFSGCSELKHAIIGNRVTSIEESTFEKCSNLTNITIPDSVTIIGEAAFEKCSKLTNVTIGNGVTTISADAFADCYSLMKVTICNKQTGIEEFAFSGCSRKMQIIIGNRVANIGGYAFSGYGDDFE